jgi:hypothetical protein
MSQEIKSNMNIKAEWIWRGVMALILGVLGYLISGVLSEQKEFNKHTATRLSGLEIWQAETRADRFTLKDWVVEKRSLEQVDVLNEKRLQRVEDALVNFNIGIDRIEKKVDELKNQ